MAKKNAYNSEPLAPLSNESSKLKYQFEVYVPSTKFDKKVDDKVYQARIDSTRKFLSSEFGGDTSVKASGGYVLQDADKKTGKLVKEDVTIVETSMTREQYEKKKPKLNAFIKEKQKSWKQESIGYKFEDDFYVYPKF